MVEILEKLMTISAAGREDLTPAAIVVFIFLFTFISEDAACLAAGSIAAQGKLGLAAAVGACFSGIVVGDVALYWAGRTFGAVLLKNRFAARVLEKGSIRRAAGWLERRGASAVFASRFIPGLRLPTYLAAGFLRTRFNAFFVYFLLAAAIWTPIAVGAPYLSAGLFAENIFLGAIIGVVIVRFSIKLSRSESRRLLYGRWKRLTNWEFWPVQIFYLPVAAYCAWLCIRFRSLTVFTSANPGIVGGGLIGESKHEIYKLLARSKAASPSVLKHMVVPAALPGEVQVELLNDSLTRNALSLPIVLKPDVGERGKGVTIVRQFGEIERYLETAVGDTIVQEFYDGVEASVFYYRFPTELHGKIFSITEKVFPHVVGDGISDLRTLILKDQRAVILAKSYFCQNADRLDLIPDAGESVQLINIGTHSRGAIFNDGDHLRTRELENAIDEIGRQTDGFYFGRFDLRARSFRDFQNGGPFRIIELNGVASESTNIYDPRFSLMAAYRILFRQWRLAFEVGAASRAVGAEATSLLAILRLVLGTRPGRGNSTLAASDR